MGAGQSFQDVFGRAGRIHIEGKRVPDEATSRLPACPGWGTEDTKTGSRSPPAIKERSGAPGLIAATDDRGQLRDRVQPRAKFPDFVSRL